MKVQVLLVLVGSLLFADFSYAQAPVGWRGNGTGVFSDSSPPTTWSKDKNVVWATKMPDRSNAQPVIVGDRVFTCSEPFELLCLSGGCGPLP